MSSTPARPSTQPGPADRDSLECWLIWLETRNPHRIDLGLERVRRVWQSLETRGFRAPRVITVAGTNGKGSSVAMLEAILRAEGYSVGAYTSPHLLSFTERVRIRGADIEPAPLIAAFEVLRAQPDSETLTYFEWATLAAMIAFSQAALDVWVLEVGLGGRLDAVNVLDADLALITAIGLDHQAILGHERSAIAQEKAGILRIGQPAVYMDDDPDPSVAAVAHHIGASLLVGGQHFSMGFEGSTWSLRIGDVTSVWPRPRLPGRHQVRNAAGVVALLRHPAARLMVSDESIRLGLQSTTIMGRFERWSHRGRTIILDVAHNVESMTVLLDNLNENSLLSGNEKRFAVFSALADKPIEAMISQAHPFFDRWFLAELDGVRAAPGFRLENALHTAGAGGAINEMGIVPAYNQALANSAIGDQIVVFGSFLTVSGIRPELSRSGAHLV